VAQNQIFTVIFFSFQIRKSKEYKVDKKFYDAMISNKHVNLALNRCEALSASLEDRYNFAKESNIAKVNGSNRKVTPPIKPIAPTKPVEKPAQPSSNGLSKLGNIVRKQKAVGEDSAQGIHQESVVQ
jgi:hypothetical protein